MEFNSINNFLKEIPFISPINAKYLYDFIINNRPEKILELGIAHGKGTCYMAAALNKLGSGKITSVDLIDDVRNPSAEELLKKFNFEDYADVIRMKSGYNWFLHNEIKTISDKNKGTCIPKYDLIIIDGPKNWTVDSSSFFLCDKLLNYNGTIIWDDYSWCYGKNENDVIDGITNRSLSMEERLIPHIKEIFHLLVMQHPNYGEFIIQEDIGWAWAKKTKTNRKKINYQNARSINNIIYSYLKNLLR